MKRRDFIGTTALAAGALGLPRHKLFAQPGDSPNVLLIILDDLNDWVGHLGGHPQAYTPTIDALAASGTSFTNAHCAAPACGPSRTNLLTGILPSTSGVYDNPDDWTEIIPNAVSLANLYGQNGYMTMKFGKVEHDAEGGVWDDNGPFRPNPAPPLRQANRLAETQNNRWDWGAVDLRTEDTTDYIGGSWVIDRMTTANAPFFMAYGLYRPHTPQYVPRKFIDMFPPQNVELPVYLPNDLDDIPPMGVVNSARYLHNRVTDGKQWRKAVGAYLASVAFADEQLARVFDALEASPIRDDTIVVVTSDQGWHLGEKEHWTKFALWEEATRVPLIIHVPWLSNSNQPYCDQPVTLTDLAPTLAELCGIDPPAGQYEGLSLVPQLTDPSTPRVRPALTTWLAGNHAVRDTRWRYIRYNDQTEELYDHNDDPYEWTNLASDPQYDGIKAELAQWMPDDFPGPRG